MAGNEDLILKFTIDKQLKNGNQGRSKHWSSAHKDKQEWMQKIRTAKILDSSGGHLDIEHIQTIEERVDLIITRHLGKGQRFWDADSVLRGNAKELIDSLVAFKVIPDDNTKHVGWTLGLQSSTARDSQSILAGTTEVTVVRHSELTFGKGGRLVSD